MTAGAAGGGAEMLCEQCGDREATVHLTQIVQDEHSSVHLCPECAAERGVQSDLTPPSAPLVDFLAQMGKGLPAESFSPAHQCSFCGLSLADFKRTGRLGCSHCWAEFESQLRPLLRRLHGGTRHVGKIYLSPDPHEADRTARLTHLRRSLQRAVDEEDFERAATLRDEVRLLEAEE
jgi:protein arginine kinase activator